MNDLLPAADCAANELVPAMEAIAYRTGRGRGGSALSKFHRLNMSGGSKHEEP